MIILIIWAVIAMAAAFSVYEIESHSGATASEKAELLKQTEQTLKDLNISGPEAANIIQSTQHDASTASSGVLGGVGSIVKYAVFAGILYFGYEEFIKKPKGQANK